MGCLAVNCPRTRHDLRDERHAHLDGVVFLRASDHQGDEEQACLGARPDDDWRRRVEEVVACGEQEVVAEKEPDGEQNNATGEVLLLSRRARFNGVSLGGGSNRVGHGCGRAIVMPGIPQ